MNPTRLSPVLFPLLLCSVVSAQIPAASSLRFSSTPAAPAKLTVTDPENHSWLVETSTDLVTWTPLGTWKVHNGRLDRTHALVASAQFYRMGYDPAAQTNTSTWANALLLPTLPDNYANQLLPSNFLVQPVLGEDNTPATNPVTDPAATLGRALFYDKRLSLNRTVSCASCHQAEHGFSDPRQFSVGFLGGLTDRNSMGLTNARWYQRRAFFWDERAATLEDQVLLPIQNAVEMGMTLPALETRLAAEPYYNTLFTNAFGTANVTSTRISKALAQFVRSIISTKTKYDTGLTQNFSNFTTQENQGRQLFNGAAGCAVCHGTDNFVPTNTINNNGLENPYTDKGVGAVSGRAQDEGLFKVPSLRNIELTAPYMHDGRFATLEQVVEFYNSGVVNHPNLSPPLRGPGGTPRRLNLSEAQKAALVAFLRTLTDTTVTTDERFADPFNYGD